jgi:hypothetical protein
MLEAWLRDSRAKMIPLLTELLSANKASDMFSELAIAGVRLFFAKKLSHLGWPFPKGFATGKPNVEKLGALLEAWAKHVQKRYPESQFLDRLGYKTDLGPGVVVDCSPEKAMGAPLAMARLFSAGDVVAVLRRSSWPCPSKANIEHRKDICVGTQGTVMGHDGLDLPIVSVTVTDNGAPRILVHSIKASDLQHFDKYSFEKAVTETDSAKSNLDKKEVEDKRLTPKGFEWLNAHLEASDRTSVEVTQWHKMQQDSSQDDVLYDTKGEVVYLMGVLAQIAPQLTEEDITFIHRASKDIGAPRKVELWAKRAFAPFELVLVPYTHEIKDRFWTKGRCAMLRTSKGLAALLGNKTLALDGRLRADFHVPQKDDKRQEVRRGSLFFCVQRTLVKKEANLVLSYAKPSLNVSVTMPGKKKVSKQERNSEIEIPLLTNTGAIKAHTLLVAMDDVALNEVIVLETAATAKRVSEQAQAAAKKARKA